MERTQNIIMSVSGECVAFGRHIDGVARTHGLSFVTTTTAGIEQDTVVSSTCH